MSHVGDALVLTTSVILIESRVLSGFRFELQLDKLFDRFWAFFRGVVLRMYVKFIA